MNIEIDVATIIKAHDTIESLFGGDWLKDNVRPFLTSPTTNPPTRYEDAVREPKHPFVQWCIDYEIWRKQLLEQARFPLSRLAVQFLTLGNSLSKFVLDPHIATLIKRLKEPNRFYATVFEIEIAESYLNRGWNVIFVPEASSHSTPDLEVTRDDGTVFWVECKNLELLSERDKRDQALWGELKSSLFHYLLSNKLSFAVLIIAKRYLETKDIAYLKKAVAKFIEQGKYITLASGEKMAFQPTPDDTGSFEIGITELSHHNSMFSTDDFLRSISAEDLDNFEYFLQGLKQKEEVISALPFALAFRSEMKSDRILAVENAFQSAAKQLPSSGPGVICIRVPDNSWGPNYEHQRAQIERVLKKELSGNHNRRVNAAQVDTRYFEDVEKDGIKGLVYRDFSLVIKHTNPKIHYGD